MFQPRSSSDSQPPEDSAQTGESLPAEAQIQLSPLGSTDQEVPFTEVHAQLAPAEQEEDKEVKEEREVKEEMKEVKEEEEVNEEEVKREEEVKEVKEEEEEELSGMEANLSVMSEEVSQAYALSSTLPQEEKEEEGY